MSRVFILLALCSLANANISANLQGDEVLLQVLKKIERLEGRIQEQDDVIAGHQLQIQTLKMNVDKLSDEIRSLKEMRPSPVSRSVAETSGGLMRTCEEIRSADPASASGMYYVDPDGQGTGHYPIHVFCNMSTGATIVSHDSEDAMAIEHCLEPGCYSRSVNYNATVRQMTALAHLSAHCRQFVQFDCYAVPFELNGETFAWWNDRHGNPQTYWAGDNSSRHTCQCGIDGNCVVPSFSCNCDAAAAFALRDQGYLTDKEVLPVTKLNFGRSLAPDSSGRHTLGKFECTGTSVVDGMPKSCADLWKLGHKLNGFYSVQGQSDMQSVYCDFTKLPGEAGMQALMGSIDIKSSPVYFHVGISWSNNYNMTGIVTYDVEYLNIGGALNLTSGIFTAPKSGVYFFSFNGMKVTNNVSTYAHLRLNDNIMAQIVGPNIANYFSMPLSSTLKLKKGDEVKVTLSCLPETCIPCLRGGFTSFSGILLEEDLFPSNN